MAGGEKRVRKIRNSTLVAQTFLTAALPTFLWAELAVAKGSHQRWKPAIHKALRYFDCGLPRRAHVSRD